MRRSILMFAVLAVFGFAAQAYAIGITIHLSDTEGKELAAGTPCLVSLDKSEQKHLGVVQDHGALQVRGKEGQKFRVACQTEDKAHSSEVVTLSSNAKTTLHLQPKGLSGILNPGPVFQPCLGCTPGF